MTNLVPLILIPCMLVSQFLGSVAHRHDEFNENRFSQNEVSRPTGQRSGLHFHVFGAAHHHHGHVHGSDHVHGSHSHQADHHSDWCSSESNTEDVPHDDGTIYLNFERLDYSNFQIVNFRIAKTWVPFLFVADVNPGDLSAQTFRTNVNQVGSVPIGGRDRVLNHCALLL